MPNTYAEIKARKESDPEYAERLKGYARKYREENKDKERHRQKESKAISRNSSREAYNAYMREWTNKNKERLNLERRLRRLIDPEYAEKVRQRDRARPKDQVKNKRLRNEYGITLDEYKKMYESQDKKCAICENEFELGKNGLAVDHCHKSGVIRGLICTSCNNGLGRFRDNVDYLERAIKYLNKLKIKE